MRVVADTNTVVSGLLWHGAPRQVLDAAQAGAIDLFTSAILLAELEEVLGRGKFSQRLALADGSPHELVIGHAALALVIEPAVIPPVIAADPDDDAVLACAIAASAEAIVSGDSDLLSLQEYEGISILGASDLLHRLEWPEVQDAEGP
jgi:putative PIN family toxin of toxin-antitoxin system